MLQNKKIISVALVVVTLAVVAVSASQIYGLLSAATTVSNIGVIKTIGVGVYSDSDCINAVTEINWGVIEPDSSSNVTVYIRNEGNAPVTLYLNTTNWNPSDASNYITLSWNYGEQALDPNEVVQVILTLSVSDSIEGITNYNFDIIIAATG